MNHRLDWRRKKTKRRFAATVRYCRMFQEKCYPDGEPVYGFAYMDDPRLFLAGDGDRGEIENWMDAVKYMARYGEPRESGWGMRLTRSGVGIDIHPPWGLGVTWDPRS